MSNVDEGVLYRGGNYKAEKAWQSVQIAVSRTLPGRLRAANKLAQKTKMSPMMRKRG